MFHKVPLHVLLLTNVIELLVYIHIGCLSDTAGKLRVINRKRKHNKLPQCCAEGHVYSVTRMNVNKTVMETKIACMKKRRADKIRGKPAAIQPGSFCLLVCYTRIKKKRKGKAVPLQARGVQRVPGS